jgi:hypothetical protein
MSNPKTLATLGIIVVPCLVCPVLPVSLDCPFLITPSVFSNVYFRPMSCVPSVASDIGLSIRNYSFKNGQSKDTGNTGHTRHGTTINVRENRFSNVYCRPMSCVPSVASFFGLSIRDYSFGFL